MVICPEGRRDAVVAALAWLLGFGVFAAVAVLGVLGWLVAGLLVAAFLVFLPSRDYASTRAGLRILAGIAFGGLMYLGLALLQGTGDPPTGEETVGRGSSVLSGRSAR